MKRWQYAQLSSQDIWFSHPSPGRLDEFADILGVQLDRGKSTDELIRYRSPGAWEIAVAALGDAGWELVGFDHQHRWVFKKGQE